MRGKNIVIFGALSDGKFRSKVNPLINHDKISKVYLYRYLGNPFDEKVSKKITLKKPALFSRSKYAYYLYTSFSIIRTALKKKVDLLIAFYFIPFGIIVGLVGILINKPYILILPGSDLKWISRRKRLLFVLKKSYKIGVRGNNSLEKLVALGIPRSKLFVLHNAFNLPELPQEEKSERKWDIVFIGYFRKPKRLDVSVDVVEKLKNNIPNIKCVFIGDGSEFENIKALIKQKGLQENISLTGHSNEIEMFLKKSKVFLLTSESEGLPMVLVEAMSYGVPVVTSDINDISDVVVHNENGYLVKSLKRDEYVTSILQLLQDENKHRSMSSKARESMVDFYNNYSSFDSVQKKWVEVVFTS